MLELNGTFSTNWLYHDKKNQSLLEMFIFDKQLNICCLLVLIKRQRVQSDHNFL